MITANEALQRLREGNRRFVSGARNETPGNVRLSEVAKNQAPLAIVLGCSDSRVPAEIVFDQSLGDLFVIRVAGNVVAPSQIGSVEFAAERFGTRLVVVLGHTGCGAVQATLEEMQRPTSDQSPNLRSIVERIRPAVEHVVRTQGSAEVLAQAVRANIRASAERLRKGSESLEDLIRRDGLVIAAAEYSLETGEVDFFDLLSEEDGSPRRTV